jgi:quercetin dioxygenase-like cupin family protein
MLSGMANERTRPIARRAELPTVESPAGIFRTTLAYDEQTMLCHFRLTRGARIPMHSHPAVQNGYMISGRMKFLLGDAKSFEAVPGTGWCFLSGEPHAAEVLEDSEVVECFAPARPEYI